MQLLELLLQSLSALDTVQRITIYALPVIFAITVHEAAHGYAARHFGDLTAEAAGRISLNPLRHIDPVGTLLIPTLTMLVGGILFGWAKPVPINFSKLHHPKRDMLWVAIAGPAANLSMALLWALAIRTSPLLPNFIAVPLALMGAAGIMINVVLMVLNLLPLPPLDGGRIVVSLLPNHLAYRFAKIEPYGFIILILLMLTHVLGSILWPMIDVVLNFISWIIF